MKIKTGLMSLLLIMIIVAACGPAVESNAPPTAPTKGALEAVTQPADAPATDVPAMATEPTPQPDMPEAYPPMPTAVPLPENYPAPAQAVVTADPYPEAVDGFIWMLLPAGVQCEDDASTYADLQDAVAGLTAVSVLTGQIEVTELNVCAACGCPTSAHYRVQVSVADVGVAQTLGWQRE
ncbi:MAG: hypothetical protein H6667_21505 [Ardenticatenaceae bacterium]|nr:hypothetical protein [Ardenticatenaceae bacterium]MCB9446611.1 hypothetical protein [Ardenticatenaceae bacterium]